MKSFDCLWRGAASAFALVAACAGLAGCSNATSVSARDAQEMADYEAAQALVRQAPPPGAASDDWLQGERARLRREQAEAERAFSDEEHTCWQRFAVNDCLHRARLARRAQVEKIRQQQWALAALERQRKADVRLQDLQQKAERQRQRQASASSGAPGGAQLQTSPEPSE